MSDLGMMMTGAGLPREPAPFGGAELCGTLPALPRNDFFREHQALSGRERAEKLIEFFSNDDQTVRLSAIKLLTEIRGPALEPLKAALQVNDTRVQYCAVAALRHLEHDAVPILLDALKENSGEGPAHRELLRKPILLALGKIAADSKNVIPALREALKTAEWGDEARAAVIALDNFGQQSVVAIPEIGAALNHKDLTVGREAARVLPHLDERAALDAAMRAMGSGGEPARINGLQVISNLIEMRTSRGREELLGFLLDQAQTLKDPVMMRGAVAALGAFGREAGGPAIHVLRLALHRPDVRLVELAALSLARIGENSIPTVLRALASDNRNAKYGAAIVLEKLGIAAFGAAPSLAANLAKVDPKFTGTESEVGGINLRRQLGRALAAVGEGIHNEARPTIWSKIRGGFTEAVTDLKKAAQGLGVVKLFRLGESAFKRMVGDQPVTPYATPQAFGAWCRDKLGGIADRLTPRKPANAAIPTALGCIAEELARGAPQARLNLLYGLSNISFDVAGSQRLIRSCLSDESPQVRRAAVRILVEAGPLTRGSVYGLVESMYDEDSRVRRAAVEALHKLARRQGRELKNFLPALKERAIAAQGAEVKQLLDEALVLVDPKTAKRVVEERNARAAA